MTTRRTVLLLSLGALVAGCGGFRQSRLNPLNWFGRSRARAQAAPAEAVAVPDPLVEEVVSFVVEPIRGGAILRATGRNPTQGWWAADLVERATEETDVLTLDFRIFPPVGDTDVNTPRSREVTVAVYRSDIRLSGIREIVVQGRTNARSSSR